MCRRIYMNRQCLNLSAGFRYTKTWISQLQLWKIELDFWVMDGIISLCLSDNCEAGMEGRTSFMWVVSGRGSKTDSSSSGVKETCCGPPSHSSQLSSSFLSDEGLWKPARKICKVSLPLSLQHIFCEVSMFYIYSKNSFEKHLNLFVFNSKNEWMNLHVM